MCVDLHTHSLYSDGTLSPTELVLMAVDRGLTCLALTDHDTTAGVPELQQAAQKAGLAVISGVEISTSYQGHTLHILGYGIAPDNPALHEWLSPLQNGRANRNQVILDNLDNLGIHISPEELAEEAGDGQTGRPHFARILVQRGIVPTMDAAFEQYLGHGKAAWAPRFSYESPAAIAMIHASGGRAVLAHPGVLSQDIRLLSEIIRELTATGLDGVEVYYPAHGRRLRRQLLEVARMQGLLVTGGSDYHGDTRPAHTIASAQSNFCPPDSLLQPLLAALGQEGFDCARI